MKRFILLLLMCLLLVGCGKKEDTSGEDVTPTDTTSVDTTSNNVILQPPVQLAPPAESEAKETSTTVEKDITVEEKVEFTNSEDIELDVEDFKDFTLDINEDKPMEVSVNVYNCTMKTGMSLNTKDEYLDVMGNTFIYQDGVNYTIIGEQYHKCAGPSIMEESDNSNGFDISSDIRSEDITELDGSVVGSIDSAVKSGDVITLNGYVGDEEEPIPIEIVIDADTHELISFGTYDEETGMEISCVVLDYWKPVPDVEFEEVDLETIEEDAGVMLQSVMSSLFMGLASDPNVMNEYNKMAEYTNEFDITFEDEFESVNLDSVNDIGDELDDKYNARCFGYSYTGHGCILTFRSKEELSTEMKENLRQDVFDYLITQPDTILSK